MAEERVDQKTYEQNRGNIVAELIHLLTLPELYIDNKKEFAQYIKGIVQGYKQGQEKG